MSGWNWMCLATWPLSIAAILLSIGSARRNKRTAEATWKWKP